MEKQQREKVYNHVIQWKIRPTTYFPLFTAVRTLGNGDVPAVISLIVASPAGIERRGIPVSVHGIVRFSYP